jgi:hypothetical protein
VAVSQVQTPDFTGTVKVIAMSVCESRPAGTASAPYFLDDAQVAAKLILSL